MAIVIVRIDAGDRAEDIADAIRESGVLTFTEKTGGATSQVALGDVTIEE